MISDTFPIFAHKYLTSSTGSMNAGSSGFNPDFKSHPGETISDILEERGMSKNSFFKMIGIMNLDLDGLLNGSVPINLELSIALSRTLGSTPEFWLRREAIYRGQES